jgi:tetraacyldisaccharide 4'-kinase
VRDWWEGEAGLLGGLAAWTTVPAELLFRAVVAMRNRAYDRGWLPVRRGSVPVVSVGNLTVGGAGKTPVSAWIARRLVKMGARPAILVRGYGRDEIDLHLRWNPDVPVVVAARRLQGAEEAARGGAGVVVLDDGFQHRALARDLDIVLVPAEAPRRPRLLPRGPYREPPGAVRRADLAMVVRRTASQEEAEEMEARLRSSWPGLPTAIAHLEPRGWMDLAGQARETPAGPLLAVASVANPVGFALLVERITGRRPELLAYPDHHEYSPADVAEIRQAARGRDLVTTEKDAVKLFTLFDEPDGALVLPLRVRLTRGKDTVRRSLGRLIEGKEGW